MKTSLGDYLNDPSTIRYDADLRLRMLNIAYTEYYNELVRVGHQGLLATPADLSITASTETVALPDDFFMVYKLSKNKTSSREPLTYRDNINVGVYTSGVGSGDSYVPDYAIQGSNILLMPLPSETHTEGLHLEYFPVITAMTTDGTTTATGFSSQFHPLIPLKAAILIKGTKEGESVGNLANLLMIMEKPFRSLIQSLTKQKKRVTRFIT